MTKLIASLTAALVLTLAGTSIGGRAHAAAIAPEGLRAAADELAAVKKVQFIWGGQTLLLVRYRMAGSGLVQVRLSQAPRLRLGRSYRMARLA